MADSMWIATAAIIVYLAVGLALLVRYGDRILGPMFWYELVRLTRRGQQPILRSVVVGALLIGLMITYIQQSPGTAIDAILNPNQFRLSIDQTAQFSRTFFIAFLIVQLSVVVLITPTVAGSAIAEEKERGSLDYLRASLLSNREIILGKLVARLVFIGGVILAGLPVLSLTLLFGGVDIRELLAGYWLTLMTAFSIAAFSLYLGVARHSLRDVLVTVYGALFGITIFGFCFGCCLPGVGGASPFSVLGYMIWEVPSNNRSLNPADGWYWINLSVFTFLYGIASVVWIALSISKVRNPPPRHYKPKLASGRQTRRRADEEDETGPNMPSPRRRSFTVPRLGLGNPFLWKEIHFAGRLAPAESSLFTGCGIGAATALLFVLGGALIVALIAEAAEQTWTGRSLNPLARFVLSLGTGFLGLAYAVRNASSVARERQQQTLDGLLMLPVPRSQIFDAKWIAPIFAYKWWGLGLAVAYAGALLSLAIHPLAFLISIGLSVIYLTFCLSLGIYFSVRCATTTRAMSYSLSVLLGLMFAPLIASPLLGLLMEELMPALMRAGKGAQVAYHLSPAIALWDSLFGWRDFSDDRANPDLAPTLGLIVLLMMGLAVITFLLRMASLRRFSREGR